MVGVFAALIADHKVFSYSLRVTVSLFLVLQMVVWNLRHHINVVKAVSGSSMLPDVANSPQANILGAAQGDEPTLSKD